MYRPFSTREPYPSWYRNLPISIQMPWRNLGCLGVKIGHFYADVFMRPSFGVYWNYKGRRCYPIAQTKIWFRKTRVGSWMNTNIFRQAESIATDYRMAFYFDEKNMNRYPPRYLRAWYDVISYPIAVWRVVRYNVYGKTMCKHFGHVSNIDVHEFVAAERDDQGRITDIDGGGVDWYCPRCGDGGRSWW